MSRSDEPEEPVPSDALTPAANVVAAPSWRQSRTALVLGALMVVIGVGGFVLAAAYPESAARAPRAVSALVAVTAAVLTVRSARNLARGVREEGIPLRRVVNFADGSGITFRVTVLATLYVAAFQLFGFIIATAGFLFAAAYLLGERRVLALIALGPVATLVIYVVFSQLFGIRLPGL